MDRYLIKNGTLLSILDGSEQKADVLVEGGVITRIGANLDCAGAEVYDAAGMFVTVGWLEAHCHFLRPGSAVSLNPTDDLLRQGITYALDLGTVGPDDYVTCIEAVRTMSELRFRAYLNIAHAGVYPPGKTVDFEGPEDIVPERDVWFLDHDGEHIGTCTGFIWGCGGAWQADGEHCVGDLHWVGIKASHRGLGLSKYLSNIIQVTLKERGVRYVSLTTGEGRPAAVKSYLTAGFLPVEYAEGMMERWEKVLEKYGIDHVQMLCEDASPYKVIYRSGKSL